MFPEGLEDLTDRPVNFFDGVCDQRLVRVVERFGDRKRPMNHGVGKVQEKRLVAVLSDEPNRLFGVTFGQRGLVGRILDHFFVAEDRNLVFRFVAGFHLRSCQAVAEPDVIGELVCRIKPHVVAVGNAPVGIKPLIGWQAGRQMAEMPLANAGGPVAGVFEHVGDRHFIRVKALLAVGEQHRAHAETLIMAAGQQGGPRSRADSTAHIEVGELRAFSSHPVQVRSFGNGRSVEADVSISHVINEDDDDVGARR